jgi:molybdenum cofactor biosynthesis enzyme MoaA
MNMPLKIQKSAKQSPAMLEHPRLVCIETTNYCNAKCNFCPNEVLERGKKTMSDDLYEKIIDDCTRFPLREIEPFMNGEPFMDKQIVPRMELIRRRLPDTKLRLYTNANIMFPDKIDQLIGLGIDHLFVSLNTTDPAEYERVMKIPLQRTLDNLRYLTDPVRKHKVANKITFRMARHSTMPLQEQDDFLEFCKDHKVRPFIVGMFNYKGYIETPLPVPNYPCANITRLDILSNGKVTLCCMDQDGEYELGDLNTHSVLEVHNAARAVEYREHHRTGRRTQIEPCDVCNVCSPSLTHMGPLKTVQFALESRRYFMKHKPRGRKPPLDAPYQPPQA